MTDYPLLQQLLGAYLHQDWDLEAPDAITAFLLGVREGYLGRLSPLLEELERLQTEVDSLDPDRGDRRLYSLGAYISTVKAGYTPASWVAKLVEEVRKLQSDARPAKG